MYIFLHFRDMIFQCIAHISSGNNSKKEVNSGFQYSFRTEKMCIIFGRQMCNGTCKGTN